MTKYQAIIFDMDGVIIDSEPLHERAFQLVFQELGYGNNHAMDFPAYYGRSDRVFWLDFVAKYRPIQTLEELIALKQNRFMELIRKTKPIFPEIPALLARLAPRYGLGLASGSLHVVIDEVLAMQPLRHYFSAIVSVQDVAKGKPAPDVFLRTAELLQRAPKDCCVVEDAAAGVDAALAAGMDVIGITNSLPAEKLAHATHVVRTYHEIEQLLVTGF